MRLKSINEIIKNEYINTLRDQLKEQYYYTNRSVHIYKKGNTIFFDLKTCVVNINYINNFISNIDKNKIKQVFKKDINFSINQCKRICANHH